MKFTQTPLEGAFLIDLERRVDDRGFFARFFCERELQQAGLPHHFVQANDSFSALKGTIRGMHYQMAPKQEDKMVRCIQGALWDVILDLRVGSPTFGKWFGHILSAANRTMMFVPKGFAHGLYTLEPNTEALYCVTESYSAEHERIVRWNDPTFAIEWPGTPEAMSDKDAHAPDFDPAYHLGRKR